MRKSATDRAPVPDLHVADIPGRLGDEGMRIPERGRVEQVAIRGGGTDASGASIVGDSRELVDAADVEHTGGGDHPELQERDQRLSASEKLRPVIRGQRRDHLVDRFGASVFECGGNHDAPPFAS